MQLPTVYKGNEPYIFISYSHRDKERVYPILSRLVDAGFRLWFDEGIDPGTEWDENIAGHIGSCAYFIALLTENYMGSKNCKDELSYARSLDKGRLLVYLESVELPEGMKMRLNRLQAIHWYKYGSDSDTPFKKLCHAPGIGVCRTASAAEDVESVEKTEAGKPTNDAASTKKPRRWWIPAVCVVLAAAAAGLLLSRLGHGGGGKDGTPLPEEASVAAPEATAEVEPTPVYNISFSAGDMPVGSYKTNLEILERRIDLLADGADYTFTTSDGAAELTIPREAFGDANPNDLLNRFLCAGAALYIYDYNSAFLAGGSVPHSDGYDRISREDIASVAMEQGRLPVSTDGMPWYLSPSDDYTYLTITLTDEAAQRLAAEIDGWLPALMLDYDSPDYIALRSYPGEDERTWYVIPYTNSQTEIGLLSELIQSEPLDHRFSFELAFDPDWQSVAALTTPGANQVDFEELTGPAITLVYSFSFEVTEGNRIDEEPILKARLDELDTPYSFGLWLDGYVVRLSPSHMLEDVAGCIGSYSAGLKWMSGLRKYSGTLSVSLDDPGDGTYALIVTPSDYGRDQAIAFEERSIEQGDPIELRLGSTTLLVAKLTAVEEDGSIRFDTLNTADGAQVTADTVWLLNVLLSIENGTSLPASLTLDDIRWDSETDTYGLALCNDMEETMERIREAVPEAEVSLRSDKDIAVALDLPVDEMLVPTAAAMTKTVFEASGFAASDAEAIIVYLTDEQSDTPLRTRIIFDKVYADYSYDEAEEGCVSAHGIFAGKRVERYADAFRALVENDAFFGPLTEAYPYSDAWVYEW